MLVVVVVADVLRRIINAHKSTQRPNRRQTTHAPDASGQWHITRIIIIITLRTRHSSSSSARPRRHALASSAVTRGALAILYINIVINEIVTTHDALRWHLLWTNGARALLHRT